MLFPTARRALLGLTLSLTLAACGGADSGAAQPAGAAAGPTSAGAAQACATSAPTAQAPAGISTDLGVAPAVPPSDAAPPCGLVVSDVVVGTGAEAVSGSTVAVRYLGAFYGTGQEFDSSWSRGAGETLPVTLGAGQVIPGFEQAITGMKVGGRRLVTIPSDLAYGPQGAGPIPGGATLDFVLDLVSVSA
jgi:FKBP-type peptidyl-prolyl cis-trans isomerase